MVTSTAATERLLAALRLRRVASARELGEALGVSQPSISRLLAAAGPQVAPLGQARRRRYAAVRDVRGLGTRWPLYRLDERGQPQAFGELTALHGGGCLIRTVGTPDWHQGACVDGFHPGLPWFLDDQRPQGFLGRRFAQRRATALGLPDDLLHWNNDAVLAALLCHGEDAPGDFVLGDAALERALRHAPEALPAADRASDYAQLAQAALGGEPVGFAAGEQPKFATAVREADGSLRHVIVKFAEPAASPAARRWADLLTAEHLAAELLTRHGHPGARTELIHAHGWLCLEATRFDRVGTHGRRGFVTLAAWSGAHDGERDDWPAAAARMRHGGWIDEATLDAIRLRWWFGRLIGNTGMHFGNLGFFLGDTLPLPLAPSYDMLPMLYRPATGGSVVARAFDPPPPRPAALPCWSEAAAVASRYWQQVAAHPGISDDFRRLADANHATVQGPRRRFATDAA